MKFRTIGQDDTPLPIPDNGLPRTSDRGIITGANAEHWTCLGALAIAAYEQRLGLAVADHGLNEQQRKELQRVGVRWIEHLTPELTPSKLEDRISAPLRAWWKPWICEASPFERTAWIDSDTAVTGDLSPLFQDDLFMVSTQFQFSSRVGVYVMLFSHVFPDRDIKELPIQIIALNTGIMAFSKDEPLLREWQNETIQLLKDPVALQRCYVRDQSSFIVALARRHYTGQELPIFLSDEYNWPADGLSSHATGKRSPVSRSPQQFLNEARQRHSNAKIVHWLGKPKPHNLHVSPKLNTRICGIVVCVGLGETLAQTVPHNRRHFDEYIVITTSDDDLTQSVAKSVKIVISDRCYEPGDSFNKGKLLNAGVAASTCDWILFHDADIILPPDFRERIQREQLDPDKLYYASRFNADVGSINWQRPPQDNSINIGPFGYFQLWNRRSKFVAEQNPVSENWPTAATSDVHFKNHWPSKNLVKLPISVAHLRHGDWGERWNGPKASNWRFVTQSLNGRFLKEPALTYPCEVMLQRIDTEERRVYTAHNPSEIMEWRKAGIWFDVYAKQEAGQC